MTESVWLFTPLEHEIIRLCNELATTWGGMCFEQQWCCDVNAREGGGGSGLIVINIIFNTMFGQCVECTWPKKWTTRVKERVREWGKSRAESECAKRRIEESAAKCCELQTCSLARDMVSVQHIKVIMSELHFPSWFYVFKNTNKWLQHLIVRCKKAGDVYAWK